MGIFWVLKEKVGFLVFFFFSFFLLNCIFFQIVFFFFELLFVIFFSCLGFLSCILPCFVRFSIPFLQVLNGYPRVLGGDSWNKDLVLRAARLGFLGDFLLGVLKVLFKGFCTAQ